MKYYLVWVRSARYHGSEALTYASELTLTTGAIVQVELQKQLVLGVVTGSVGEPRFKTKQITRAYDLAPVPPHLIKTADWLRQYYPAPLGVIAQQILPAEFTEKQLENIPAISESPLATTDLPTLTADQQAAYGAMQRTNSYLLHGRTGSGKTRLYIAMAQKTITSGESVIVLTPEISLTSQLADNFRKVFGGRVIVLHSQQAPAERRKAWLSILQTTVPIIVVGPRSALYTPVAKLGLIILDESHEAAYKQEQAPQYQTGRVAAFLAHSIRATLILGSATPSVSDYYLSLQKQKPVIELNNPAKPIEVKTTVTIVDMKQREHFSRSPHFSQALVAAVSAALSRGEQSLLYLNRRGTARIIMCEHCGWQAACPHCDLPLTYHGDSHSLRCHSCDFHEKSPSSCPSCGHPSIMFKTAGTKAIVEAVERLFPGARVARFDTDNRKAERFEQHYEAVKNGEVDILVGTQLLAKGLDLPKLSVLGILLADTSLYLPDYSATERTFQLLNQVLGRIGRGHVAGHAIIQTYHPEHPILTQAIAGDYKSFYDQEIQERQTFLFPPFCFMLKLTARRASSKSAEAAAEKLRAALEHGDRKIRVEGPAPAFHERFQGKYQWQLVIKSVDRSELIKIINDLPANWSYDIDPTDLL
ncbi:primosomal protein N' [Candidatus Saccharibacteria bacterium]|nr:primosomal protein N' [Candidatus Saccharibacteria bacterium]